MAQEAEDHDQQEMVADLGSKDPGTDVYLWELSATDNGKNRETLQEAFRKFRKKRQEKLRNVKSIRVNPHSVQNEVQLWELRQKFIEQAKHYIGVPYAKKFHDPGTKLQFHDIVHVEIWFGDGEKTLGARLRNGGVQIFDSYKFDSPLYENMEYHFKSIDTWLQGNCVSHCSEHKGDSTTHIPGKWSIFALEHADEMAEDDTEDIEADNTATADETLQDSKTEPPDHNMTISAQVQNNPREVIPKIPIQTRNEIKETRNGESFKISDTISPPTLDSSVRAQNNPTEMRPQIPKQTMNETSDSISDIVLTGNTESTDNSIIHVIYSKTDSSERSSSANSSIPNPEQVTQCMKCNLRTDKDRNVPQEPGSELSGVEQDEKEEPSQTAQTSQVASSSSLIASNSNAYAVRFLQHELLYIFCPLFLAFALELLAVYLFLL
ncbi:uncharacterized protein LOC103187438 isoform X2 [Callorhinchus milii]|uniref:uncharacterized protein LOC103187438 isoform X2 n=1 Tax=Callorhinchus milii TaxID=7868 RepID=UPI00045760FA|nr:uncharacterized protein LOC103187438 isoform X2 [Callorhinchus milii]|eukprot:gi/632977049/ref/XP_007905131.1/ PREDICTED: uncharacterized protein LOC103187438 isoform X2 [Callorhinchus milii]